MENILETINLGQEFLAFPTQGRNMLMVSFSIVAISSFILAGVSLFYKKQKEKGFKISDKVAVIGYVIIATFVFFFSLFGFSYLAGLKSQSVHLSDKEKLQIILISKGLETIKKKEPQLLYGKTEILYYNKQYHKKKFALMEEVLESSMQDSVLTSYEANLIFSTFKILKNNHEEYLREEKKKEKEQVSLYKKTKLENDYQEILKRKGIKKWKKQFLNTLQEVLLQG